MPRLGLSAVVDFALKSLISLCFKTCLLPTLLPTELQSITIQAARYNWLKFPFFDM